MGTSLNGFILNITILMRVSFKGGCFNVSNLTYISFSGDILMGYF